MRKKISGRWFVAALCAAMTVGTAGCAQYLQGNTQTAQESTQADAQESTGESESAKENESANPGESAPDAAGPDAPGGPDGRRGPGGEPGRRGTGDPAEDGSILAKIIQVQDGTLTVREANSPEDPFSAGEQVVWTVTSETKITKNGETAAEEDLAADSIVRAELDGTIVVSIDIRDGDAVFGQPGTPDENGRPDDHGPGAPQGGRPGEDSGNGQASPEGKDRGPGRPQDGPKGKDAPENGKTEKAAETGTDNQTETEKQE